MRQQHPFGHDITADDIISTMSQLKGWEDRYRQVIQWGKKLPALAVEDKIDSALVSGCEAQVWLHCEFDDAQHLHLRADADARIVKGLVCLVLAAYQGKTRDEIAAVDFASYFEQLGMANHLTPTRNNGVFAVVERIKSLTL